MSFGAALWETLKFLFAFGLVLGLAYFTSRWLSRQGGLRQQSGVMRLVGQLPLGARPSAAILQVGERRFLLGVTDQEVRLLAELETEEGEPDSGRGEEGKAAPDWRRFRELMGRYLQRQGDEGKGGSGHEG